MPPKLAFWCLAGMQRGEWICFHVKISKTCASWPVLDLPASSRLTYPMALQTSWLGWFHKPRKSSPRPQNSSFTFISCLSKCQEHIPNCSAVLGLPLNCPNPGDPCVLSVLSGVSLGSLPATAPPTPRFRGVSLVAQCRTLSCLA